MMMMMRAAAAALDVAYEGSGDDPANATTYTFTDMPIGNASADRTVVAIIGIRSLSPITVSEVTIGGTTATIDVSQSHPENAAYTATVLARATIPTGTTATVVASITSAGLRALAATYSISGAVAVVGTANASNPGPQTLVLSPATGPIVLAAQSEGSNAIIGIESGATEDANMVSSESIQFRMVVGHSTESPASVVFANNPNNPAGVAVAYEGA